MTPTTKGWGLFLAALGIMAGLLGNDIMQMHDLGEVLSPAFIGSALIHLGTVIGAFMAGKIIPTARAVWTPEERTARHAAVPPTA